MKFRARIIIAWVLIGSCAGFAEAEDLRRVMREVDARMALPASQMLQGVLRPKPEPRHGEAPVITTVAIQPVVTGRTAGSQQLLAAAGDDHSIRLWRLDDGRTVGTLQGHEDWVRSVVFTPDGHSLITAGDDGRVLQWDLDVLTSEPDLQQQPVVLYRQEQTLYDIAISPQGDRLFFVGFDSKLHTVSLASRHQGEVKTCPCNDMRTIAVSANGQHVASGGRNGMLHIWSLPSWKCGGEVQAHKRRVRSMAFAHGGQWLVSAGEDRSIVVTEVISGRQIMRLSSGPAKILAIAICGDNVLASAGSDNKIRLWDLQTRTQLGTLNGHSGSVAALASNGETLVSGSYDTTVRIWRIREAVDELQARLERESEHSIR